MTLRGVREKRSYLVGVLVLSAVFAAPAWAGSPPTVTGLSPRYDSETGGEDVQVYGTNFEEVIEVRFGEVGTTKFFVAKPTALAVTAPPGKAGTVYVTVVTASGTSEATSADVFTYLTNPEYGRCRKFGGGFYEYKTEKCDSYSEIYAPYSWYPAFGPLQPLQKRDFTTAGGAVKLETVGRALISCKAEAGAGEYTAAQTVAETITLTGCHEGAASCRSEGAGEGEVHTNSLDGLLGGFVKVSKIGQELSPASGEVLAEFECAGTPVTVRGAVIGEVKKTNEMTTTETWKAKEKRGTQGVTVLRGDPEATLQVKIGAGGYEGAGLGGSFIQTSEEAVEIW